MRYVLLAFHIVLEDSFKILEYFLPIQISEVEERQMDISETKKCYVFGQCQVSEYDPLTYSSHILK